MHQRKKIGIFLCSCGNTISKTINFKEIIDYFKSFNEVELIEENSFLCKPEILIGFKKKIKDNNLNGVIVAACSPQLKGTFFRKALEEAGLNFNLISLVNLREQCDMTYKGKRSATKSAIDLIKGALRRIKLQQSIASKTVKIKQNALVIGGGVAGLQTTINLSKLGHPVVLLERESFLGGNVNSESLFKYKQTNINLKELVNKKIEEVNNNQQIQVFTQAELIKLEGAVGNFKATIEIKDKDKRRERKSLNVGAVVLATGCQSYFPSEKYGIDLSSLVITQSQLGKLMNFKKAGLNGINTICFISGIIGDDQRLEGDRLLNQALILATKYKIQVYILCKNVYVAEEGLEELYQQAQEKGIIFLKYDQKKPEIKSEASTDKIDVSLYDSLLGKDFYDEGKELIISCDLLVLEEQIIPASGSKKLSEILQVGCDEEGFYQQKNISLQPVFTNRKGILVVGACRGLMNIIQTLDDSGMASLEIHNLLKEKLVRYNLDRAMVDNDKCTLCLTCMRVCPHKAIQLNESKSPNQVSIKVNDLACEICGICVSQCPAAAITLPRYKNDQIMAEIGQTI
ncbi:FAD-dependent oxidoreductase [bacterium]|nr:FAD-dependent oxidoreductase [bacterium]